MVAYNVVAVVVVVAAAVVRCVSTGCATIVFVSYSECCNLLTHNVMLIAVTVIVTVVVFLWQVSLGVDCFSKNYCLLNLM